MKGTGISLSEASKNSTISVSGGSISNNLTIADVLTEWSKSGVLCIMETKSNGTAQLRVGLTYYAGKGGGKLPNNDKNISHIMVETILSCLFSLTGMWRKIN